MLWPKFVYISRVRAECNQCRALHNRYIDHDFDSCFRMDRVDSRHDKTDSMKYSYMCVHPLYHLWGFTKCFSGSCEIWDFGIRRVSFLLCKWKWGCFITICCVLKTRLVFFLIWKSLVFRSIDVTTSFLCILWICHWWYHNRNDPI